MRCAPQTLLATLFIALLPLSGCILGANTGGGSTDTTTASDTAEADTTVADTAVADTGGADTDVSEDADGGEGRCDYKGKSDGVCANGVSNPSGCLLPGQYDYVNEEDSRHCDGADNDCDGTVDEQCSCTPDFIDQQMEGEGVCANAVRGEDGDCQVTDYVETESSQCDALDNDCDGEVDEECSCMPGDGEDNPPEEEECFPADDSYLGVGACEAGQRTCTQDGRWGACSGAVVPRQEDCDTPEDENCDGTVNEGCACNYQGKAKGVCRGGGELTGPGMCTVQPQLYESPEVSADGKDNDCDGEVDEGTVRAGGKCSNDVECRSGFCSKTGCAQRIFVTSKAFQGASFSGAGGADTQCQKLARGAGLAGRWRAMVPEVRLPLRKRVNFLDSGTVNLGGELLAEDEADLFDASLKNPVRYKENGKGLRSVAGNGEVWTGVTSDGSTGANHCRYWRDSVFSGRKVTGRVGSAFIDQRDRTTGDAWLFKQKTVACGETARLFCIDGQ